MDGEVSRDLTGADAWIMSRLHAVIREIDDLYERFEFAKVATTLYHFAWDEVCDWYVELAKVTLLGPRGDVTRRVLGEVLDVLLRLLHPLMPFVTEVLWTTLTGRESIVIAPWPIAEPGWTDGAAEAQIARVQAVVSEGRRFRADQGLKPSARIPARITGLVDGVTEARWLLRLDEPGASFQPTASVTVPGGVLVEVDLSGTIDVAAERVFDPAPVVVMARVPAIEDEVDPSQVERVQLTFTYLDAELGSQPVVLPQSASAADTWETTSALLSQAGT